MAKAFARLLHVADDAIGADQGVEDRQNVAAVFDHARENVSQLGLALGFTMPLGQHCRGYLNILAKFLGRIAAQKQPIKEGRFPLGEFEIGGDLRCQDWCNGCHKENRSLLKTSAASSSTCDFLLPARQYRGRKPGVTYRLLTNTNRRRMLKGMARLPKSLAGRTIGRFLRFGMLRGLRTVEVNADDFRKYLSDRHGLWVPHFGHMRDVPLERFDAIAERLIHDSQGWALAQGACVRLG